MGRARTRPRALNHSRSLFGLFTHFLFCIPQHSPALQLPGDFSHRRANKTISHAGQQLSGLTPQHLSTTSPRPSPSPSSSSLACGHPSSQQGNPHSQPQPWATSPKPQGAGPVPCPGPRQGGGMEQEPKGPQRPQRAALTCQRINTPLSSRLFTQTRCSGDGSSLSKRRAAPLGKQPGVYLNVKQESRFFGFATTTPVGCEAGRTPCRGWMDGWMDGTVVPDPAGAPQAGSTREERVLPAVRGRGRQGCAASAASVAFPDISISAGFAFAAGKVPRWKGPARPAAPAVERGPQAGGFLGSPHPGDAAPSLLLPWGHPAGTPALEACGDHVPGGTAAPLRAMETKEGPRHAPLPPAPHQTPGCRLCRARPCVEPAKSLSQGQDNPTGAGATTRGVPGTRTPTPRRGLPKPQPGSVLSVSATG